MLAVLLASVWAVMALAIDLPFPRLRIVAAAVYGLGGACSLRLKRRDSLLGLLCFLAVLTWWVTLRPSDDKQWGADQSRTAWADVHGQRGHHP